MPVTISGTTGIATPAVNATGNIQAAGNVIGTGVCPAGVVLPFAIPTAPTGWLVCNGTIIPTSGSLQGVDASLLQTLRSLLGTTYGVLGQLPNLQGQFIRGLTTNFTTTSRDPLSSTRVLGNVQSDIFRAHSHDITDPGHSHLINYRTPQWVSDSDRGTGSSTFSVDAPVQPGTTADVTGITINNQGGTETRPVNIALLYCIKY